jgi:hypothetical protein
VNFKGCGGFLFTKDKLKRYYGRKDLQLITVSCYQRMLVKHPKDWAWSCWGFREKGQEGLIGIERMK